MDTPRDITMTIAKYSAYIGIMVAIIFEKKNNFLLSATLCSFLIVIGSLRQYVIENEYNYLKKYTFIVDIIIITALTYLDYSNVYIVGYYVIVVEGIILCPDLIGFLITVTCYLSYSLISLRMSSIKSIKELVLSMFYYSLPFIFFYGISFLTKKQIEQREELQETVDKLGKSKIELEQAYEKLIVSNKRIHELALLEERNRMAREIHDTLAHTLTTVIVEIEAGKKLMKKGSLNAVEEFEKAQNQARIGLDEVRHSVKNLRSKILIKEGFEGALNTTLEQIKTMGEIDIKFEIDEEIEISEDYEMILFRIIQEASTNSFRHGKSKNIFISLKNNESNIKLVIHDDGIGCDKIKAGYGLLGIKERVRKFGGQVTIESSSGNGFKLDVLLPREGALPNAKNKDTNCG
jgi:signal transduction histidine kinase